MLRKLEQYGVGSLTDSELIRLAGFGDGVNLELLQAAECLADYRRAGLTKRQAVMLHSVQVLRSRRTASAVRKVGRSQDIADLLAPIYIGAEVERFNVVYLNRQNVVKDVRQISSGGVLGTVADEKVIFRPAIELFATGIVLSHNHPSGNRQPSEEDKKVTQRIAAGAKLIGVTVLDHVIMVPGGGFYSFADEGLI